MMLVGAFGLLMLRSMVRQRPAPPPAAPEAESPTPSLSVVSDEEEEDEPEAEPKPRRKKRFASAGANIKDELASMVRENPDAAANILRGWIGEAG